MNHTGGRVCIAAAETMLILAEGLRLEQISTKFVNGAILHRLRQGQRIYWPTAVFPTTLDRIDSPNESRGMQPDEPNPARLSPPVSICRTRQRRPARK